MKDVKKIVFYVLSVLLGVCAFIEVTIAAMIYYKTYSSGIHQFIGYGSSGSAMIWLMTSGSLVVLCSALGIYGAINNNKSCLILCTVLTFVNFIIHSLGISAAFISDLIFERDAVEELEFRRGQYVYHNTTDFIPFMNTLQRTFSCCGVKDATEWLPDIPASCCAEYLRNDNCTVAQAFDRSCGSLAYVSWDDRVFALQVAALASFIATFQLIFGGLTIAIIRSTVSYARAASN
ncbi:23 kDa integral membrane protein-like [Cloeon dipterum]|uniref:23 kDa integral membrane protein-like n=1 Tax=Cloeon dipterum TaxID=197152 RepID=UPI0032202C09